MAELHQIYLVPGFFGFARLGDLMYFHYVQDALEAELGRLGIKAQVIPVETLPTASIIRRGRQLFNAIQATDWRKADAIHLIGHSTGGLDARVLVSPTVTVGDASIEAAITKKIKTVVTLCTPHFGSPIAGFFTTAYGKNLLQLLSVLTARASSNVSGSALSLGFKLATRFQERLGLNDTLLVQLSDQLLDDFTPERRDALLAYTRQIQQDQGALIQLTPEGMDLFNASVHDNPSVRYYSFMAAAPPPPRLPPAEATINPRVAIGYVLYRTMWDIVSEVHPAYPYHGLTAMEKLTYEQKLRFNLDSQSSDGVVPSLSQYWGHCVDVLRGDHLDVVGHYGRPRGTAQFADWLRSGARFGETQFISLYRQIASLLVHGLPPGLSDLDRSVRHAPAGEGAQS